MARYCGLLLHITSLPSRFGVGDLGPEAGRFARFLADAGQKYWQILPISPTSPALGNSPYSVFSAFAGHPLLISPERLAQDGWLPAAELAQWEEPSNGPVHYERVYPRRMELLEQVFLRHREQLDENRDFDRFCGTKGIWLNDYAMFMALKQHLGGSWIDWPAPLRDRHDTALAEWGTQLAEDILFNKFLQFLFFAQWRALRRELADLSIDLMGDIPIYVSLDSADVWANRHLFRLDKTGRPTHVAGVPPDYFARDGQLWGNPVFDWQACEREGFSWWNYRIEHNFGLFDAVRLDHFRAFAAYWEVPAEEETARRGYWVDGPGTRFFDQLRQKQGDLRLIAEDLGVITRDVVALRQNYGYPGMRVTQFGMGADSGHNPNAVHNHDHNCVVYTGTHDNNTALGWYVDDASREERKRFSLYAGSRITVNNAAREMVRLAFSSCARTCIVPVQDVLGLASSARMNTPGTANGNWTWRLQPGALTEAHAADIRSLVEQYGRDGGEVHVDDYA